MADVKTKSYQIVINGLKESISAVDSLNKQLDALDKRLNALSSKTVNVSTNTNSSKSSSTSSLSEEAKLEKQIEQLEEKRIAYSKEIYQNYLAAKDVLQETVEDQKEIAAQERLQANTYSNTMKGMKQQLSDIKKVMQTTDLGSDEFKDMTKKAKELTDKLKELEESYGQFGRNVGNYKSAFDDIKKVTVQIGGTAREFNSVRDASRQLTQELKAMVIAGKEDTKEYKELAEAVHNFEMAAKRAESAVNDLKASSSGMDDILDMFESFSALGSIGQGLSAFFGFDDAEIQRSIQKLVALQNVMQGIEKIRQQMNTQEGIGKIFAQGNTAIDSFVARITGAQIGINGLTKSSRAATVAVRGLSLALKGIGIGIAMFAISKVIDGISNLGKEMNSTESQTNRLDEALKSLNKTYEERNNMLSSTYLKGGISDEEFLSRQYQSQTEYLSEQISLLRERASLMARQNEFGGFWSMDFLDSGTKGGSFTGNKMNGASTVESYSWLSDLTPMLKVTVNNIKEVEDEFKKCNEAIHDSEDYFTKWGNGVFDWVNSLFTTVKDTERVLVGLGNIRLSDFVASFAEVNEQFKNGQISAEEYGKKIGELKNELNSSDVLRSVIANLDKYIPDEGVREAVNNIINEIIKLDDAFNMTSPAQIHHWMQVRIDGMKEGTAKIKAQMDADEKYEIAQYGKTQEQINLIQAKYNRKRQDALDKYNEQNKNKAKQHARELEAVENELIALRIENMKEGLEKQLAAIDNERRLALQKARENGIKYGELELEINKKYDRKIIEEKRRWAFEVIRTYEDLASRIIQLNKNTFDREANTASQNVEMKQNKSELSTGYSMITPTNYDDSKNLEAYYKKIIDIRKNAIEREAQIEQESLDKQYELNKREEELRHKRITDLNNGEFIQQLRNGKITQEQYDKLMEDEKDAHNAAMNALDKEYASNSEKVTQESLEEQRKLYSDYYGNIINNLRRDKSKIDEILSAQPTVDKAGWNIVNIGATNNAYKKALEEYDKLKNGVIKKQEELDADLKAGRIKPEDFAIRKEELDNELKGIDKSIQDLLTRQKSLIGDFVQSLMPYIQAVANSFNQIMSAVWNAQDTQFEKEQEMLDKENEIIQDKLSKQADIISDYKSKINSIEDELATSRGDRRQHLIDQLNAEMEAERRAQKEKERLEKEEERNKKKQEDLEKKRKKAQYERDKLQAIVNGAMAVTYAAINTWPIPAIPMMALAASTTAAQLAIMASNKPYAKGGQLDGGVAVGNRHRDGGIKVLGGRAEIEGGEFITNRLTTEKNLDLLEFVNSKKKRIDVNDLLEFYSSGSVKKNIAKVKTKFEDGGYVPTLPNALDIRDQLQNVIINQDNRPIYVSVVDINNKQAQVRNVQTLAGLSE